MKQSRDNLFYQSRKIISRCPHEPSRTVKPLHTVQGAVGLFCKIRNNRREIECRAKTVESPSCVKGASHKEEVHVRLAIGGAPVGGPHKETGVFTHRSEDVGERIKRVSLNSRISFQKNQIICPLTTLTATFICDDNAIVNIHILLFYKENFLSHFLNRILFFLT